MLIDRHQFVHFMYFVHMTFETVFSGEVLFADWTPHWFSVFFVVDGSYVSF